MGWYTKYFKNNPMRDGAFYFLIVAGFCGYSFMALFAEMWVSYWKCQIPPPALDYPNSLYDGDPCLSVRYFEIGYMSRREAEHIRRMIFAVVLGSIIGYERRGPDRPAGIRIMSVTSLGACTFTLAGTFAFLSGPMTWDASRISASIPSGVGFLGAGLIWKGFVKQNDGNPDQHQVHGLTTAASIWMSAAIGVASGGGMYFDAAFATLTIVLILRFGPRNRPVLEEEEAEEEAALETMAEECKKAMEMSPVDDDDEAAAAAAEEDGDSPHPILALRRMDTRDSVTEAAQQLDRAMERHRQRRKQEFSQFVL